MEQSRVFQFQLEISQVEFYLLLLVEDRLGEHHNPTIFLSDSPGTALAFTKTGCVRVKLGLGGGFRMTSKGFGAAGVVDM